MIKENGQIVTCPVCGSDNVEPVHPFDYWKMCHNEKCPYHIESPNGYKYVFSTGVHN